MPAPHGVINGTNYIVNVGGKFLIGGVSAGFSVTTGTKDLSCRETDSWKEISTSEREWSLELEGKLMYTYVGGSTYGGFSPVEAIYDGILYPLTSGYNRKLYLAIYSVTSGMKNWWGYGYLVNASIEAPNEDNSSVKLSFKGAGPLAMYTQP